MTKKRKTADNRVDHQQEKTYERTFGSLGKVRVHIAVSVTDFCENDTREVIQRFSECSQAFYFELANALNKKH